MDASGCPSTHNDKNGNNVSAAENISFETQTRGRREKLLLLIDEMNRRYNNRSRFGRCKRFLHLWWKRTSWKSTVKMAEVLKRVIDIVVSVSGMVLLSPLFIVVAAAVKLTDGGPVFYRQYRVGKHGRIFGLPKFRSMKVDADEQKTELMDMNSHVDEKIFKMHEDPRVTRIGRILRKYSIDELPQLWNVLKGDMSLVGPRPPVQSEVDNYTVFDRRRLDITPGLTCFWQINGRSDIPFDRQVEYDVMYIQSRSLFTDIIILLKTIPAVLSGRGAY